MKSILHLGAIASILLLAASCATTGNPREGGLFGYSEKGAQQRLRDREDTLNALESDTARERERTPGLEAEKRRKQRELDHIQ